MTKGDEWMNVIDNPVLVRGIVIAALGVAVGLVLSIGVGLSLWRWKMMAGLIGEHKPEAFAEPKEELLPALLMGITPISKVFYAFVAVTVLSQRNLADSELSIAATFAGGAFALVAVVQGALAAKLINTPTAKEGLFGTFRFKMAMLGSIETLAVFVLVGIMVFTARFSA